MHTDGASTQISVGKNQKGWVTIRFADVIKVFD